MAQSQPRKPTSEEIERLKALDGDDEDIGLPVALVGVFIIIAFITVVIALSMILR